jgi:hypothetical protein
MDLPDAPDLRRLAGYLALRPSFPPNAGPGGQSLGSDWSGPAPPDFTETITGLRRLAYAAGEFRQTGLFEYQIGLIYLQERSLTEAAEQFRRARQQWSFLGDGCLLCLAELSAGLARHYASDLEAASQSYAWTEEHLSEAACFRPEDELNDGYRPEHFLRELTTLLRAAQAALREHARQAYRPATVVEDEVPLPIVREADQPAPAASWMLGLRLEYALPQPLSLSQFVEVSLRDLQAIVKIDRSLKDATGQGGETQPTLEGLDLSGPVNFFLAGLAPQSQSLLSQLAAICSRLRRFRRDNPSSGVAATAGLEGELWRLSMTVAPPGMGLAERDQVVDVILPTLQSLVESWSQLEVTVS